MSAPIVEREPAGEAPADERPAPTEAPPALAAELPFAGWLGDRYDDEPVDRIVWSGPEALVFVGGLWGATDMFQVHADLALAGSTTEARLTIEVVACRQPRPRGPIVARTRALGTTLRWVDVSARAARPEGCTVAGLGMDAGAWLHDTPVRCPATAHAYVAVHCAHRWCITFGLFDDVPPSESALMRAVGAGRFEWVSAPGPAGPCD